MPVTFVKEKITNDLVFNILNDTNNIKGKTFPDLSFLLIKKIKQAKHSNNSQDNWVKFSNGLIMQWGETRSYSVNFPIEFPNGCYMVLFIPSHIQEYGFGVYEIKNRSFKISQRDRQGNVPPPWCAFGY